MSLTKSKSRYNTTTGKVEGWNGANYRGIKFTELDATTIPVYATNAAALIGGLTAGQLYKTAATGDSALMIVSAT